MVIMTLKEVIKMGVSCVTITIEEFERLKEAQKKVLAIEEVISKNKEILRKTNRDMICLMIQNKFKEANAVKEKQDDINVDVLIAIDEIIFTRSTDNE